MTTLCEAWAIKAPDGVVIVATIRLSRVDAKSEFMKLYAGVGAVWFDYESEGYRCVRVRVEEIENTTSSREE